MSFRDTFTKSKEQLLDYDDTASLYFLGTATFCILVPVWWHWFKKLALRSRLRVLCNHELPADDLYPKQSEEGSLYSTCRCNECQPGFRERFVEKHRWRGLLRSWSFILQTLLLLTLSVMLVRVCYRLASTTEIQAFDPFEILGVNALSSTKTIKRAYRTLSLKHHPDKNPDDPTSAAKFIMIAKAYQALTDETARQNYEKYGNPDGPGAMKVGIGLPHFLVDKDNHGLILALFLTILIFVLPYVFIQYYYEARRYNVQGTRIDTVHFLAIFLTDGIKPKTCLDYIAASAESRDQQIHPSDLKNLEPLEAQLKNYKKPKLTDPVVARNHLLLTLHMQRLANRLPSRLKADLTELLKMVPMICQSMCHIVYVHNWYPAVKAVAQCHRALIQALPPDGSPFLQLPHVSKQGTTVLSSAVRTAIAIAQAQGSGSDCARGGGDDSSASSTEGGPPNAASRTLEEDAKTFRSMVEPGPLRSLWISNLSHLSDSEKRDIVDVCNQLPRLSLESRAFVAGETNIAEGDVLTIAMKVTRRNLPTVTSKEQKRQPTAAGPVHAPLFPAEKYEEWWFFLSEIPYGPPNRETLLSFSRMRSTEREVNVEFKILLDRAGARELSILGMCDSYFGLDVTDKVNFTVHKRSEVNREIFVHAEDEALDDQPGLAAQFMAGGLDEHADEEDGDENREEGGADAKKNL